MSGPHALRISSRRGPNLWSRQPVLVVETPAGGASALGHKVHALQMMCRSRVSAVHTAPSGHACAIEFEEEELARACLAAVIETPDPEAETRLRSLASQVLLGPNTRALWDAARRRGIPVRRLGQGSLLILGYGAKQRKLWGALTDATSSIAESVSWEKPLAKVLLEAAGVPVAEGRQVASAADAVSFARQLNAPIVIKPESANHGRGVFIGLTHTAEISAAFEAATAEGSGKVMAERAIDGHEHRVLVVQGRVVAATCGEPLYVAGDGVRTISQLIDEVNSDPRRGDRDDLPLSPVTLEPTVVAAIARQGFTPESVPASGTRVLIQRNGNLAADVTDRVHPANRDLCALAAEAIGLDIAGIDLVVEDISRPLADQGGAILEVNAMPGLLMHLQPGSGAPRPVDDMIVEAVYPAGENGRIPIVAVNGPAEIAQAIHRQLQSAGVVTALADLSTAPRVLMHPRLRAAVFETPDGAVSNEGLGFDYCSVLVTADPGSPAGALLRDILEPKGIVLDSAKPDAATAAASHVLRALRSAGSPAHLRP